MRYTAIVAIATCCLALSGCSADETPVSPPPPASTPALVAESAPPPIESAPAADAPSDPAESDLADLPTVHPAPGRAACRQAIKDQYVPGTLTLKGKPSRPKECDGLTTDEVSEIATSVIDELTR